MYEQHPVFVAPLDENARIWRYTSIEGLLSMLSRRALFFVRASKLEDQYEGTLPTFNELTAESVYKPHIPTNYDFEKFRRQLSETYDSFKRIMLISSWSLNDFELANMWRARETGVLIESTFKKLCDSFKDNGKDSIHIGIVRYIDFDREWLPEDNLFAAFVTKRREFQCEYEIRAIRMLPTSLIGLKTAPGQPNVPDEKIDPNEMLGNGKYVSLDISRLVSRIHVAPMAGEWTVPALQSALAKYGIDTPVEKSNIYG